MAADAATLNPKASPFQMPMFNPEAPAFIPVSSMRAEAATFVPTMGPQGLLAPWMAPLPKASTGAAYQQKQKREMPPATEEEWETRIAKREKEVSTIKSLQSYRLYVEVFPPGNRGEDCPKTPDPRDRTVSKRMWKWNVEKWRLQLKSRCVYSRAVMLTCRELLKNKEAEDCIEIAECVSRSAGQADFDAAANDRVFQGAAAEPASSTALGALRALPAERSTPEPPGLVLRPSGAGLFQ